MNLPESLTKVTLLSKIIAGFLFILLPFFGFYLGYKYHEQITPNNNLKVLTNDIGDTKINPKITSSSLISTNNPNKNQIQTTPIPSPDQVLLETYRAPGFIGFRIKYPKDKKIGDIKEHTENGDNLEISQDENLILWQSTIILQGADVIISRKHNINPISKTPYNSLTDYDSKTVSFKTIKVNFYDGKDSGDFLNSSGKHERDVYLFRDDYIWLIQEISTDNLPIKYLDTILPTFTLFVYSPNASSTYKDLTN